MSRAPKNLPMLSPAGGKALLTMRRMSLENASPSSQPNSPIFTSKQKMFDQLFIFGSSPEKNSSETPIILTMFPSTEYPQNDADLEYIKQHCFPNGFKEVSNDFPASQTIINEFIFFLNSPTPTQPQNTKSGANNSISNEFNNDRVYGIVVQFRAPPDFTPYFASTVNRRFPFALCLLSHKYYLSSHFQFATYAALVLTGRAAVVQNRVRTPLPVRGFCHPTLTLDKKTPAVAVFPGLAAPIHLLDIILKYLSRPIDPQSTPFIDTPYADKIPMSIPLNMTLMQCLSYPSTDLLFSCLNIEQIILIYEAILLEKKVAFISNSPHNSSLCVLACMSFLRPFKTFSEFIPVLTEADRSLTANPIVCGIYYSKESEMADLISVFDVIAIVNNVSENATNINSPSSTNSSLSLQSDSIVSSDAINSNSMGSSSIISIVQAFIEGDENRVIFTSELPHLPHYDEIVRKIGLVIQNRIVQVKVPPSHIKSGFFGKNSPNPDFQAFVEKEIEPFAFTPYYIACVRTQRYVFPAFLVDSIREILASNIAIEMNEKLKGCLQQVQERKFTFAEKFNEDDREFIVNFTKTKTFDDFLNRTIRQVERKNAGNMSPTHAIAANHFGGSPSPPTSKPVPFPVISKKISIKSPTAAFSPFQRDENDG